MKKFVLLAMLALTTFTMRANSCCNPCDCIDWCEGWEISGEWLFWSARRSGLDYVAQVNTTPVFDGKMYAVTPDYRSGFRVGLAMPLCCAELGVRYTYFHPTYSDQIERSFSNTPSDLVETRINSDEKRVTINDVRFAKAHYALNLDIIDLEYTHEFPSLCSFTSSLFGGIKVALIDQELEVEYRDLNPAAPEADFFSATVDMNAYGLYLGGDLAREICGPLALFGNFSFGTLLGSFDRTLNAHSHNSLIMDGHLDREYCLVQNINISAGLSCLCGSWTLTAGYEFHTWVNMLDFLSLNESSNGSVFDPSRNLESLGFDGLFVGAQIRF